MPSQQKQKEYLSPKPELFLDINYLTDTQTELSEDLKNALYLHRDKGSLSPSNLKKITLIPEEFKQFNARYLTPEIATFRAKLKRSDGNVEAFEQTTQAFMTTLKTISQDTVSPGKFTEPKKKLEDIQEELSLLSFELTTYINELETYKDFLMSIEEKSFTYTKFYNNPDSKTIHFGINLVTMSSKHCDKLLEKDSLTTVTSDSTKVSPSASKKSKNPPNIKLHPVEIYLIRTAIAELQMKEYKAVLIDIFAREGNFIKEEEKINDEGHKEKTGKPETHTIVLYKQPLKTQDAENQFVIIDPSNSKFSKHISSTNNSIRLFSKDEEINIVTSHESLIIYEPKDKYKVGPEPQKYRDCVDIAVKLAFRLNASDEYIDPKAIAKSNTVMCITNQSENFFAIAETPLRIKQASDIKISQQANDLLNLANHQDLYTPPGFETFHNKINENTKSAFSINYARDEYEKAIISLAATLKLNQDKIKEIYFESIHSIVGPESWTQVDELSTIYGQTDQPASTEETDS